METNGGTLPSCWLCIIVLRCVTQMNGSELSAACSDGCQFLGHCSEICDRVVTIQGQAAIVRALDSVTTGTKRF